MKRQIDLFTADVVGFPVWRRADLVRSTADKLDALPVEKQQEWWTLHCLALADDLRATGKDDGDVAGDLQQYANAVASEIAWRQDEQQGPGVA